MAVVDRELAPLGHGVAGVDPRFMSTCSIWPGSALTQPEARRQHVDQLDVLADDPPQHLLHVLPTMWFRSSGSGCNTCLRLKARSWLGQRRGALAGLRHLLEVVPQRIALPQPLQRELGVAQDDREQVVEVVGDAAGEPPEASIFWAWRS